MNFNMPMAVFGGLALIAAAIYFGPGSHSATAQSGIQKVVICPNNWTDYGCGNTVEVN